MQTVPTSACAVSFIPAASPPGRCAPEFAGAIDRSETSPSIGMRLLVDGVVNEGKIQGVDPQVCVVVSGRVMPTPSQPITGACSPLQIEELPELEIETHDGQFKEKSKTLVLLSNCCCDSCAASKKCSALSNARGLLSHHRKKANFVKRYRHPESYCQR